ncbi:hypothetical protein A9G48_04830 [Gilliamella sp. wkB18]|uniref:polymorphic toxin-type HINT domain-containing protein n=1 Tax=Gilliamella sp. wkB18 TaxID=3120260 RepID=UPI0004DCDD64|nr:polymorphic toxin-type HINT domain-containing protein [Gilliamella apicola]KFA59025.1 YD repeat [Gilliamella apicola]OCG63786.1 hypothetical protein A9G48_04830 [Gilliamella apicola]
MEIGYGRKTQPMAISLKKVTAIIRKQIDTTVQIELEGETIETTAEHPFYTKQGWKDAADLTEQDHIKTKNKKWYRVKRQNFLYTKKKVYTFEVEDWHTYFVGKLAWLVHNAKPCLSGIFKFIERYGIKSYKELKALVKGKGLQVHHFIEKRFANILGVNKREILSIVLTKEEHQIFTNAWRKAIPYGTKPTKELITKVAKEIYKYYPEILKVLKL